MNESIHSSINLSTYMYLFVRAATLTREVTGSYPGKSHWWMTGRASGPKMLTAPANSQLTIGHRPSPVKTGSV